MSTSTHHCELLIDIELDDVAEHMGEEMAEKVRRNTLRYKEIIACAIDNVLPAPTPAAEATTQRQSPAPVGAHRCRGAGEGWVRRALHGVGAGRRVGEVRGWW